MNITIIAVGKMKEKYMVEGLKEYSKRLSRYCNLKILEVADEKTPDNLGRREMDIIRGKEGQRILSKIPPKSYVISLVIDGKQLSSEELSERMDQLMIDGINHITFIIGGSIGLSQEVMDRSNFRLSFSKMTFPHQLMRMMLLEQIYRGFKIMRGEPYHK
ncbi:MAG: 23S rRNA (pseudouridine(1915)-N(3))-methyltransferase RlmH [Tissierellia bacterium]|nr:23S rRNA (pseudouridine(1915)-N(3))-methyltransferase RlmH [Tissierellia bacterium]